MHIISNRAWQLACLYRFCVLWLCQFTLLTNMESSMKYSPTLSLADLEEIRAIDKAIKEQNEVPFSLEAYFQKALELKKERDLIRLEQNKQLWAEMDAHQRSGRGYGLRPEKRLPIYNPRADFTGPIKLDPVKDKDAIEKWTASGFLKKAEKRELTIDRDLEEIRTIDREAQAQCKPNEHALRLEDILRIKEKVEDETAEHAIRLFTIEEKEQRKARMEKRAREESEAMEARRRKHFLETISQKEIMSDEVQEKFKKVEEELKNLDIAEKDKFFVGHAMRIGAMKEYKEEQLRLADETAATKYNSFSPQFDKKKECIGITDINFPGPSRGLRVDQKWEAERRYHRAQFTGPIVLDPVKDKDTIEKCYEMGLWKRPTL